MSFQCQGLSHRDFSYQGFSSPSLLKWLCLTLPLSASLGMGLSLKPALGQAVLSVPNVPLPNGVVYYEDPTTFGGNPRARYVVYVNSDSLDVLERVRMVEPTAVIETLGDRQVIRAGSFNQFANAQQRRQNLALWGVRSDINTSAIGGPATPVSTPRGYYVVVPGPSEEIDNFAWLARRIGTQGGFIQQNRQGPRGAHLAIGPFGTRSEASNVENRLQRGGLGNARVFFGRL